MKTVNRHRCKTPVAVAATALFCLGSAAGQAAETPTGEPTLFGSDSHRLVHDGSSHPSADAFHPGTPMMLDPGFAGFPFSAEGDESRRLQLRLAQPLTLSGGSQSIGNGETALLGLDATLQVPVTAGLSLAGRVDQTLGEDGFRALGSIHCNNGILRSDSYTASGCRFVNDTDSQFDRRTLSMGPQLELGNLTTSLSWFTSETRYQPGVAALGPWRGTPALDPGLAALDAATGGLLPGSLAASQLAGETSGIDLDFQVGFTTDQAGEVRLGLALTRIYGASYEGFQESLGNPIHWNIAEPFNTAALGIEWHHGSFSGGVRGYYRDGVSFLDRSRLDSMGTFDVHFTWRTPWNANLSVGTSNVLNAGVDTRVANDKPADRFESIYGRIPYVRYQQDL